MCLPLQAKRDTSKKEENEEAFSPAPQFPSSASCLPTGCPPCATCARRACCWTCVAVEVNVLRLALENLELHPQDVLILRAARCMKGMGRV